MIRRLAAGSAAALAAILALAACSSPAPPPPVPDFGDAPLSRFEYRHVAMAIEARVVLYAPDEPTAKAAAGDAFAALDAIDAMASDYRVDSPVSRLNAQAGRPPVGIPTELADLLDTAKLVSRASRGAFDPTAGSVIALWRQARRDGALPSADVVRDSRAAYYPRAEGLRVTRGAFGTACARLQQAGMRLDLGAIAKGWALDDALAALRARGVRSALIEMGGDLRLGAAPPGEPGWRVRAGCGEGGGGTTEEELVLSDAAVATSGDSSQSVTIDGVRWSHIVDPMTGWALTDHLCATVVMREQPNDWPALQQAWFGEGNAAGTADAVAPLLAAARAHPGALADALSCAARVSGSRLGRALAFACGASDVRFEDASLTPLFDGATLSGWTPRGGRYDGDAVWDVEDGCLVGRTGPDDAGGLLYTEQLFTSARFEMDVRLDHPFDSGVFLRMAPEGKGMQVTLDDRPDGELGSLYADGWIAHADQSVLPWRRDGWNHVEVVSTGFDMRVQAWLNGVLVMDRVVPQEHDGHGAPVYAPRGRLGLQVHGGGGEAASARARFRNIAVQVLPANERPERRSTASLMSWNDYPDAYPFHGLDVPLNRSRFAELLRMQELPAWQDLIVSAPDGTPALFEQVDGEGAGRPPTDYRIVDGELHIPSSPPAGALRTKEDFRDLEVWLEYRQARMSNSGLYLRSKRGTTGPDGAVVSGGNPSFSGAEVQILDDWNWEAVTDTHLEDWQFTGSLYGAVAPFAKGLLAPIGEWNRMEVLYRGPRLAVALNGLTLYDVDTSKLDVDPPFAQRVPEGFLGLQRYAAPDVTDPDALVVRSWWVRRLAAH